MNAYAVVILVALLAEYLLQVAARVLNVRSQGREPPDGLADVLDPEQLRRSRDYTRARTRLGLLAAGTRLAALLVFWFAGGFAMLDEWARGWGLGPIGTGLVYIGALAAATASISLPFRVYSTFVIEERFEFNKTTPRVFISDLVKGTGLAIAVGGPTAAALLWFFEATGPLAWIWAWAFVTAFGLLLQYVTPRFIMPLFYEFEPVEDSELREAILSTARSVDFPVEEIFVMDASRRSRKTNALFTGFGRNRRVILFDTLLERHTTPELLAIVAHEIGHYKKHHIPWRIGLSVAHTGLLFLLLSVFLREEGLHHAFYVDRISVHSGLVFFLLLFSPVELLLGIPSNALSRRHEYQADRYAARTTGRPGALRRALEKLSSHNLANLRPHPLHVVLERSHPPLLQRLRALRQLEREQEEERVLREVDRSGADATSPSRSSR